LKLGMPGENRIKFLLKLNLCHRICRLFAIFL
jgi:hypothetical protein